MDAEETQIDEFGSPDGGRRTDEEDFASVDEEASPEKKRRLREDADEELGDDATLNGAIPGVHVPPPPLPANFPEGVSSEMFLCLSGLFDLKLGPMKEDLRKELKTELTKHKRAVESSVEKTVTKKLDERLNPLAARIAKLEARGKSSGAGGSSS